MQDGEIEARSLVVDAYYAWFQMEHPAYNDTAVALSTNRDDIHQFAKFMHEVLQKEFSLKGEY